MDGLIGNMKYSAIKNFDIANGPGCRVSVFVSGCRNHCEGCFNPSTWDFSFGDDFTQEVIDSIIEDLKNPANQGLSILGGDPFELENQPEVLNLIEQVRKSVPGKDIWIWTGYLYDKDLVKDGKRYIDNITQKILENVDFIIDGPYISSLRDLNLKYAGSKNQRIINMKTKEINNVN